MATQGKSIDDVTAAAGADFNTKQYLFVYLTAANTVSVCDSITDQPLGVLQNNPPSGGEARVRRRGRSKVVSDGSGTAIAVGDPVRSDTAGKAVKATTGQVYAGMSLSASAASGTIIEVDLEPNHSKLP